MPIFQVYTEDTTKKSDTIVLREEQLEAIKEAKKAFGIKDEKKGKKEEEDLKAKLYLKFLWNAKMRFGKTLCALQLAKEAGFQRTLIVTHRPVVDDGWEKDFHKVFDNATGEKYSYGRKTESEQAGGNFYQLEKAVNGSGHSHYVFFVSMQYLRLSSLVREGGDTDKLKADILNNNWDFVVVDEAHEGTRTSLGERVIKKLSKPNTRMLHLSGTPFNLYDDFKDGEIYTWDYIMEQKAKQEWAVKHPNEPNPYAELPTMKIFTYDLGKLVRGEGLVDEDAGFKFSEFFRTWTGNPRNDRAPMPDGAKGRFVHEEAVKQFLELLCKKDDTSNYPFSTDEYRKAFKHTLWVVPGVREAKALKALLEEHNVFKRFKIVNVAGNSDDDEARDDALDAVNTAIGEVPEQTHTITISCGRLTTGTTVRPWTAVFYLKGSEMTSAATYMQTIFRVQTPYHTADGRMKAECYVFDFAPDRSLKMLVETAKFSNKAQGKKNVKTMTTDEEDLETMREFLSFCPVISLEGGQMVQFDDKKLFAQLQSVLIDRIALNGFNDNALYNTEYLMSLDKAAIDKLIQMGETIAKTTNMEKPPKRGEFRTAVEMAQNGTTPEEREKARTARDKIKKGKKLTPDEEEALKKLRKQRQEEAEQREKRIKILRGISLRIPLLIFGADLVNEREEITVDNFTQLVDDDSWTEFMPRGVTKKDFDEFKKCYDPLKFAEAGKLYRVWAREADLKPIDERIKDITTIHGFFHNPDKETVLTPWRVVNLHLSSSLGGYCFYNEVFDGPNMKEVTLENGKKQLVETTEPRWVDQGSVSDEIFKQVDAGSGECPVRILEINSKTGLYPLYMAYSLYRSIKPVWQALCNDPSNPNASEENVLWDQILQNNIFVICNTPMAARITKRTLRGFRDVDNLHIQSIHLIEEATKDQQALVKKLNSEDFWFNNGGKKEMKFNAIVGNPPYQEAPQNPRDRANPLYDKFMDIAYNLSPRVSLITPGRFLFNAGQTSKAWNDKMLNDPHLKVVMFEQDSSFFFPNVDIKGGVAITYRDTNVTFEKVGTYISFAELESILKRVLKQVKDLDTNNLSTIISPRGTYRFTDLMYQDYPEAKEAVGEGTGNMITSKAFEDLPYLFLSDKPSDEYIEIYGRFDGKRVSRFVKKVYVKDNPFFKTYNVLVPEANGTGAIGEALSTPLIGEPLIGSTDTFISIGTFATLKEAENCMKYIKTKFARAMLGILKATQHNPKSTWRFVPMQNFTDDSDISWTESIDQINQQLYKKYALDLSEQAFIESHVRSME